MFNKPLKGLITLSIGVVLFLHTTGIITRGLDMLIIIFSIVLILYGFVELDGPARIRKLLKRG